MTEVEKYERIAAMCAELLEQGPVDRELGICHGLGNRNADYYPCCALLDKIVERWPHFSGSRTYPIPCDGTPYQNPGDCFNGTPDLWEGRQGELRRDLLQFIVERCKKLILNLSFPKRDIGPFRAILAE